MCDASSSPPARWMLGDDGDSCDTVCGNWGGTCTSGEWEPPGLTRTYALYTAQESEFNNILEVATQYDGTALPWEFPDMYSPNDHGSCGAGYRNISQYPNGVGPAIRFSALGSAASSTGGKCVYTAPGGVTHSQCNATAAYDGDANLYRRLCRCCGVASDVATATLPPALCSTATCTTPGEILIDLAASTSCAGQTCTDADQGICCTAPATCASMSNTDCGKGYINDSTSDTAVCAGTTCTPGLPYSYTRSSAGTDQETCCEFLDCGNQIDDTTICGHLTVSGYVDCVNASRTLENTCADCISGWAALGSDDCSPHITYCPIGEGYTAGSTTTPATCNACGAGTYSDAADAQACTTQPSLTCAAGEELLQGGLIAADSCVTCPVGTESVSGGDCTEVTCTRPTAASAPGYDFSGASETLTGLTFGVTNITCEAGYSEPLASRGGEPTATACSTSGEYTVTGCTPLSCADTSYGQPFWIEAPTNRSCTEACSNTGEDGSDLGVIRPVDGVCESGDWGLTYDGAASTTPLETQLLQAAAAWPNFTGTPTCSGQSSAYPDGLTAPLEWAAAAASGRSVNAALGTRDSSPPGVSGTWGSCVDHRGYPLWNAVDPNNLNISEAAQCAAHNGTWTAGTRSRFPMLGINADGASEGQWEMAPYALDYWGYTKCSFNSTQHYPDQEPSYVDCDYRPRDGDTATHHTGSRLCKCCATAPTCTVINDAGWLALGYSVDTATADNAPGLGAIQCATGYEGTPAITCPSGCTASPGSFSATGCNEVTCSRPTGASATGYDFSGITAGEEESAGGSFNVTNIACLPGYPGTPSATVCSTSGEYTVTGCDIAICTEIDAAAYIALGGITVTDVTGTTVPDLGAVSCATG